MTATHVRQQVCNQIAELIKTIPQYVDKVFLSRTCRLNEAEIPAAIVVFEHEDVRQIGSNRPSRGLQERTILTAVYIFERSVDDIEKLLDASSALIEEKVFTDSTLQGVAAQTILAGVESFVRSDPTLPTGAYRLLFLSTVFTLEGNPYTAIQQ